MPSYVTPKLEFSTDPLSVSNAAATWKDVTRYCISMDWGAGTSREFDDPQAGTATFLLKNTNRRFEPEYAAGAYYPNIVPGRRFRITLTADGSSTTQGIWYAQSWQVEYPAGTTYSTVTVTCTDGVWRLALKRLGNLTPSDSESYQDVVKSDNPMAYYPLNEGSGKTVVGEVGEPGTYRGYVEHVLNNPVIGSNERSALFPGGNPSAGYARLPLADEGVFFDVNRFTVEAVIKDVGGATSTIAAAGPWNSANSTHIFLLAPASVAALINTGASSTAISASGGAVTAGRHHIAGTWDGKTLRFYFDGILSGTAELSGIVDTGIANEFLYAGGSGHAGSGAQYQISHVAFYLDTLTAARVKAHADAAITLGRPVELSGTRISALISDPLWSTAGISVGTITCAAITYTGQLASESVSDAARVEQPGSLLFFDDAGNPDYQALLDTQTVSATFGDTPAEVQYDDISLVYNDELYNSSNISGEGLNGSTVENTASISDYGTRAQDATDLQITTEADAALLATAIIDRFSTPAFRVDTITLNGADQRSRTQIITRQIGDTIRVKRRGEGGTAIDIITRILAKRKTLDVNGDLRCQWTLARGFSAATSADHLGVTGYSELGQNFILA